MQLFLSSGDVSLTVKELQCVRGQIEIFSGVSFFIKSGQALILKGPNGSGKSSLLMCLASLLPCGGELSWAFTPNPEEDMPFSRLMHFIGHRPAIKRELSLAENLQFWSALSGGITKPIEKALTAAGLGGLGHYQAGHLSAGQTHRLSLARLLVSPRPVWLLDEPSSALDRDGDQWVADLITNQLASGGVVIAATHRDLALTSTSNVRSLNLGAM